MNSRQQNLIGAHVRLLNDDSEREFMVEVVRWSHNSAGQDVVVLRAIDEPTQYFSANSRPIGEGLFDLPNDMASVNIVRLLEEAVAKDPILPGDYEPAGRGVIFWNPEVEPSSLNDPPV